MALNENRLRLDIREKLAQVAQSSCGCPIPVGVQGQIGLGLEQPGILEGDPAYGRRWNEDKF